MSAQGVSGTPSPPPGGRGGCCSSGATLELVGAFTAVCLALYGVILYLNYLYVRWSGSDGVHRTSSDPGGAPRKRPGGGGIDWAALAAMPVLRFKADDAAAECAVCLSTLQDGDAVRALPGCGHAFHAACVDAWLCTRATCPVCRARPALPPPQPAPKAGAKAAAAGPAARQPDLESQVGSKPEAVCAPRSRRLPTTRRRDTCCYLPVEISAPCADKAATGKHSRRAQHVAVAGRCLRVNQSPAASVATRARGHISPGLIRKPVDALAPNLPCRQPPPSSHGRLHGALHRRQPHPALPVPRLAGQAGEGPGLRPGARAPDRHVPGRQHRRGPRPRHGEAEADEPPPAGRRVAAHRGHGGPLRLLLRPRRRRQRRRRHVRQGQAGQRHQGGRVAQDARAQRPHAGAGAQGRPHLPGGGAGQDAGHLRHQRRLHPPGLRRAMERRREQVPLPLPRIPVQQPGQGRPWARATVPGLGSRRRRRRQGALRPVGGDRLQDRRGPVVEGIITGLRQHRCAHL